MEWKTGHLESWEGLQLGGSADIGLYRNTARCGQCLTEAPCLIVSDHHSDYQGFSICRSCVESFWSPDYKELPDLDDDEDDDDNEADE